MRAGGMPPRSEESMLFGPDVGMKLRRSGYLYLIFALPFIYYLVFHYAPMYGILIAFQKYNIVKGIGGSKWVGFLHFGRFLSDPYFWKLVRNTLLLNIYNLAISFPAPIVLALLLNEVRSNGVKRFVQSVSYLPHFISTVVVCGMVVNFLASDGPIYGLIAGFGGKPSNFLLDPRWFRTIYVVSDVWQTIGWNSIVYFAALCTIDQELYEAALMDGAGRFSLVRHITLPGIMPTISIMLILALGKLMTIGFEKIILLYNGSTYETADVISTYVYRRGLLGADFSYATAVGLFQSVIGLVLLATANKAAKAVGETGLW
ncbi:MAG: sugar ABC transporter permease [Treponema sp. GWB1_62_6]|nr:MAG: sugar ABC transporter permease [Treponema sp. GWA1_62_8]OHE64891.1 MAG: sugar ABC transporter permease [Treponema sp. GWC1_61_84]OHE65039.1 MAG: sugar ABC transporter permease [Treponema sp. GWB1_62_6]HCM28121.1 sugar ABC transporter permease [Treponema sp.]